jgi:hypothetical protein
MDIPISTTAGMIIVLIFFAIFASASFGSMGGFKPITDLFEDFGKSKGELLCDKAGGQWCKNLYSCRAGHEVDMPPDAGDYLGQWKCCEITYCLPITEADWINTQSDDEVRDLNIIEFKLTDNNKNPPEVINLMEAADSNQKNVEVKYGSSYPYTLELVIEYKPNGVDKDFEYEVSTRSGNGLIMKGKATGMMQETGRTFIVGKDDMFLQVEYWDPANPNKKNTRKIPLLGSSPYDDGEKKAVYVSNDKFRATLIDPKIDAEIFYMFGEGKTRYYPYFGQGKEITTLVAQLGTEDVLTRLGEEVNECRNQCKEMDGCTGAGTYSPNEFDTRCYFCMNGDKEELELLCRMECDKSGVCVSSDFGVYLKDDRKTCTIGCSYTIKNVVDYRIETVTKNQLWNVFERDGNGWKQLDCERDITWGGNRKSLKNEDKYLKETFIETLENCR